jgi:hypothetical protein
MSKTMNVPCTVELETDGDRKWFDAYDTIWNREACVRHRAYELWRDYSGAALDNWLSAEREILATKLFIVVPSGDNGGTCVDKRFSSGDVCWVDGQPTVGGYCITPRRLSSKNSYVCVGSGFTRR